MAGGQELPEPAVRRQQGFVQRVLRPPERYVPDEGLRQRGLFGRLLLPRGEAERAGLPERRRLRGGAAHHRPGAVPRTGRGQPDRRDGGNRGLSEIAARAGRKGRRCRGSRNGHGRGGCVRRPSRTEALPGGGEALHRGGACLLGRIGHHRGGAAPLRDGIARRVPGRDEGGQGVRLQFHPGGTDVRVQGEMGREGLSPDVGGALRLWRAHGRQLLLRAGATALEGRPALPHGRREGRADAGGARLPRHLLQLGDLGHPGEDRAQAGLSLQAHRAAVRHGQDGAGMLGEAPCATGGVRGETAGAAIVGDEGGEGRDGLLQSRAHEGGADGAVPETARHAVRGHAGDAEIVRDRL